VTFILAFSSSFAKTKFDFPVLKKQLVESGVYNPKVFLKLKKCVQRAADLVDKESIGGVGLETKVSEIEKITSCKLDPHDISKNERGRTIWNFKDCDFLVVFKNEFPESLVAGAKSRLKLKTGLGMGSPILEAKKKYTKMDYRKAVAKLFFPRRSVTSQMLACLITRHWAYAETLTQSPLANTKSIATASITAKILRRK